MDRLGGHGELELFRGLRNELSELVSKRPAPRGVWLAESRIGLWILSLEVVLPAAMPGLGGLVTTRFKFLGVAGPSMFKIGSPLVHLSIEYSPSLLYGLAASTEPLQADPVNPTPILFLRSLFAARKAESILLKGKQPTKNLTCLCGTRDDADSNC
jgi:hypothetical protein